MNRITILIVLILFASQLAHGQAGYLDKTFGKNGIVLTRFLDSPTISFDVEILPNGKILQCGALLKPSGTELFVIRYDKNGNPDSSFGTNGVAWYYPRVRITRNKLIVYEDGRILIIGSSDKNAFNLLPPNITRLLPDGKIDSTFGVNGIYEGTEEYIEEYFVTAKIRDNGMIMLLGGKGENNPSYLKYRPTITMFTPNGVRNPSYGNKGVIQVGSIADTGVITDAIIDKDNNCIFAIGFPSYSTSDVRLLRCDENGVLDSNFGEMGIVNIPLSDQEDILASLSILPNGKTICLVNSYFNNKYQHSLLRLTSNGKLDSTFGDYGVAGISDVISNSYFSRCNIDSNDNIVISGDRGGHPVNEASSITARYLSNGTLDSTYGVNGATMKLPIRITELFSIDIQSDGKYLFSGYSSDTSPEWSTLLYRVNNVSTSSVHRTTLTYSTISLHPTPSTDNCTVTYTLPNSSDCSLSLRDESGRSVKTFMTSEFRAAGKHEDELDLRGLAAGVYFLSLEHGGKTETAKVVVSH